MLTFALQLRVLIIYYIALGNTYNWWIICTLVCVAPVIVAAVIMVAVIVAALLLPGGIGPAALSPSAVSSLSRTLSQPTGIQSPVITQHTCRAQGPVFPPRSIVIPLPTTTTTEGKAAVYSCMCVSCN